MNFKDLKKGQKKFYPFPGRIYVKLGLPFVWIALLLHLTPNTLSALMSVAILGSAFSFSFGMNITGIVLLWTSAVLDHIDGWVARLTNRFSPLQCQYLDRIYHDAFFAFIFLGLGIHAMVAYSNVYYFLLGIAAMTGLFTSTYIYTLTNWILIYWGNKKISHDDLAYLGAKGLMHYIYITLIFPMKYIILILTCFALLDMLHIAVIFYGLFLPLRALGYTIKNYYTIGNYQR